MKQISLTRGFVALVDDEDFERINELKWQALVAECGAVYAVHGVLNKQFGNVKLRMHRMILGALDGQQVDHKDRNGLNNQKGNLRLATVSQNQANRAKRTSKSSSQFKGVCFIPKCSKWQSGIKVNGKSLHLGLFTNEEDAARAYNAAATKHFGDYARLNAI
jgi:hypothetical protein